MVLRFAKQCHGNLKLSLLGQQRKLGHVPDEAFALPEQQALCSRCAAFVIVVFAALAIAIAIPIAVSGKPCIWEGPEVANVGSMLAKEIHACRQLGGNLLEG